MECIESGFFGIFCTYTEKYFLPHCELLITKLYGFVFSQRTVGIKVEIKVKIVDKLDVNSFFDNFVSKVNDLLKLRHLRRIFLWSKFYNIYFLDSSYNYWNNLAHLQISLGLKDFMYQLYKYFQNWVCLETLGQF